MNLRLALLALLAAAPAPGAGKIGVTVAGGSAHLTVRGRSGADLDLRRYAGAARVESARIVLSTTRGKVSYVVVELSGPTVEEGGMGYCGAGSEGNLVWIAVSRGEIVDARSLLVDSCAYSVTAMPAVVTPNGLRLEYVSYSERKRFVCTYETRAPERGFTVTEEEWKD